MVEEGVEKVVGGTSYSPEEWEGLKLVCQGIGGDSDEYEWRYEGSTDVGSGVIIEGGEMSFEMPQYGSYECLARGEAGVGFSLLILTEFEEGELARLVNSPRDGESGEGGKVEAVCKAEVVGNEVEEVEYRWTWDAEEVGEGWMVTEGGESKLEGSIERGGVLGCMVTLLPGGERLYSEGVISLPSSLPRIISSWDQPVWVVEGTMLTLTCQVSNQLFFYLFFYHFFGFSSSFSFFGGSLFAICNDVCFLLRLNHQIIQNQQLN